MSIEPQPPVANSVEAIASAVPLASTLRSEDVVHAIRTAAEAIRLPQPDFGVSFGRAESYDRLLSAEYAETVDRLALLAAAQVSGRVIVSGRGGTGKSVTLLHLTRIATERGWPAILVDLKRWSGREAQAWKDDARSADSAKRMRLFRRVVEHFGNARIKLAQFDALLPMTPKLLLLDGLNEVTSEIAEALLAGADRFAAEQVRACVIVADRLVRRPIDTKKWVLFAPVPVVQSGADQSASSLLEIPFFLDAWQQSDGEGGRSRSAIIERYLLSHAGIASDDLAPLSMAAYTAYGQLGSRTFAFGEFQRLAPAATSRLVESGVLILQANDATFYHHLLHDFLAARHVAAERSRWTRSAFQTLSFGGSAFDAVSLAFEQIPALHAQTTDVSQLCGQFLRAVYDWNPYAAAYCLADASDLVAGAVNEELKLTMLAMLAERTSDSVLSTRQRALDALALLRDPRVGADALSRDRAREIVEKTEAGSKEFRRWRAIFLRPTGAKASDEDLALLLAEDSVLGWTLANVLKRGQLTVEQQQLLRGALKTDASATLRWRAAHILGAFPTADNLNALFDALVDGDGLVRYGVARSLVEMVWTDPASREAFLRQVTEKASALLSDPPTLEGLVHAFDVNGRTPEWTRFAIDFARIFYRAVDDPAQGARWIAFAESLGGGEEAITASAA